MQRYFIFLLFSFFSFPVIPFSSATVNRSSNVYTDSLSVLKEHVVQDILETPVNAPSVLTTAGKINVDGSWSDIDYTSKRRGDWPVNVHNTRLLNMAILYIKQSGKNETLKKQILKGLDYWLANDFICPNWWYPQIGVPLAIGPLMLLMQADLSPAQLNKGIQILNRAQIGMTGQNKVWLSGNVIYRSLLINDLQKIKEAATSIKSEILISDQEGIQSDYSFHQHGPQQQFGNYGYSFADDMEKWGYIFRGTPFQFSDTQTTILRNYLLQGMRWVVWHNLLDISACGRQIAENAPAGKAAGIRAIFDKMPLADPSSKNEYLSALHDFSGNKHFWKSDMTVHRRSGFYTSVKMCSERVSGAESCNAENVLGYHLGDGATYFYQSGKEYTNIFPLWDWKLVPGTTTYHDDKPLPVLPCNGYTIKSEFVGGVDDGNNGIATMAYNRDGLSAQKSWFFFNDKIVCLGSGIASDEDKDVTTSVNQSLLRGRIVAKQNNKIAAVDNGQHVLHNVSWVLHDQWGYYFPHAASVNLNAETKNGDWNDVMKAMPSQQVRAGVFSLWMDHGNQPRHADYAYYVLPHANKNNIEKRAGSIITQNTDDLQVAEDKEQQMAGFVFTKSGAANSWLFKKISTDQPCILLIAQRGNNIDISVSDPTHKQKELTLTFEGNRKSNLNGTFNDAENQTRFLIPLPTGQDAGKSFRFSIDQ
ncbi:MAG: polysaccharide lyase 8 family protein [Niabella sp.]